ncbi:type I glyceraldehyde-3-phosphate dehydrogenase [Oceanihabitans sediminis]|uniref:Type I glyceraldehyde-3-phosphate dehydrogenase n=1 Tax=Oceanihabitans sediminis TaxID=1812012 RepID=A0A368P8J1_9FLAO|nr:type I glyceraldehyde-3-phosphate dehydrogenase [Oceanihabitans sediminis]MDX1278891.1 type I glyceraldehyde-3-phosphate dehydrogenase [Oceanihabitans sediminis]MDX1773840.1 type I glyceraldehyde-3-phosphate dehydrogenase [Oceanihabitans sediminis]RBP32136.1 glyceraldehyde 3-phosphate dehydrogenase [Oceanihabitans sediminis]RCU58786.1 type I glyceraldehyde-3-phosphate dehydrogenase [Oceanihabitans sediminis]
MVNVALNGFGRIGRRVFRLLQNNPEIQIVAINDLADAKTLSHLLKYDSIHGIFKEDISSDENHIIVNNRKVPLLNHTHPKDINWKPYKVDFVIEASGKFKDKESLNFHIENGAKRVILSVPPTDDSIKTIVLGVNDHILDGSEKIISNASCTTNNAAPMIAIMQELCGIEQAYITTVHSYTTDQSLHDQPHRDLRRARAAGQSIVPTTTGAAKALTKIFPDLADVIGGCGIRVPVANGSLTDITLHVNKNLSIEQINEAFKKAAQGKYKGILEYTEDPIVSIDIVGNTHSCIFDAQMTSTIGDMVKIIGWYDNETGYSSRIINLIRDLSTKI